MRKSLCLLTTMMAAGLMVTTSCKHDADDYVKKPYTVTDSERLAYAEKTLKTTFDKQQDWVLTANYSVKVKVDADLEGIKEIAILDGNPFVHSTNMLVKVTAHKNETIDLTFKAPLADSLCYAACITSDQQYVARPFLPGKDAVVSFQASEISKASSKMTTRGLADNAIETEASDCWDLKNHVTNLSDLLGEANRFVPAKQNNREKVEAFGNYSFITDSENDIVLNCIYSRPGVNDVKIGCRIDPSQSGTGVQTYVLQDGIANGKFYRYETPFYLLWGASIPWNYEPEKYEFKVPANSKIDFFVVHGLADLSDDMNHATCFSVNDNNYLAFDTGDKWDYHDRIFLITGGGKPAPKADVKPIVPTPQIWTYAWEDNTMEGEDRCDYDMNDCVIEVCEKADDPTMLEISIVALGATRDLWLGFENKNGQSYKDYQPVFGEGEQELHKLMKANQGEIVNTGNGYRTVEPYKATVKKPAGFDFQTCSFVLGAKVRKEMQGAYENDYYMLHVSTAGQDPHGIIIPGKWQWPTERTCIKDAYPKFNTWASDRTKCQDWYKHPNKDKVVKR